MSRSTFSQDTIDHLEPSDPPKASKQKNPSPNPSLNAPTEDSLQRAANIPRQKKRPGKSNAAQQLNTSVTSQKKRHSPAPKGALTQSNTSASPSTPVATSAPQVVTKLSSETLSLIESHRSLLFSVLHQQQNVKNPLYTHLRQKNLLSGFYAVLDQLPQKKDRKKPSRKQRVIDDEFARGLIKELVRAKTAVNLSQPSGASNGDIKMKSDKQQRTPQNVDTSKSVVSSKQNSAGTPESSRQSTLPHGTSRDKSRKHQKTDFNEQKRQRREFSSNDTRSGDFSRNGNPRGQFHRNPSDASSSYNGDRHPRQNRGDFKKGSYRRKNEGDESSFNNKRNTRQSYNRRNSVSTDGSDDAARFPPHQQRENNHRSKRTESDSNDARRKRNLSVQEEQHQIPREPSTDQVPASRDEGNNQPPSANSTHSSVVEVSMPTTDDSSSSQDAGDSLSQRSTHSGNMQVPSYPSASYGPSYTNGPSYYTPQASHHPNFMMADAYGTQYFSPHYHTMPPAAGAGYYTPQSPLPPTQQDTAYSSHNTGGVSHPYTSSNDIELFATLQEENKHLKERVAQLEKQVQSIKLINNNMHAETKNELKQIKQQLGIKL